jgi:hypothetical protein
MEIDFIGVRNANLEDAIYEAAFFAKKNLFPRHKNVCITFKLMRKLRANEGIHGDCMDEEDRDFTIRLDITQSEYELISTVIHELVHVKQYVTKQMKQEWARDVFYEKVLYPIDMKYDDRPWEIEANSLEKSLIALYYK